MQIGIIGGTGLDNPDIFHNRTEKFVDTPFGKPSDALVCGTIEGVDCVMLARYSALSLPHRRHQHCYTQAYIPPLRIATAASSAAQCSDLRFRRTRESVVNRLPSFTRT